MTELEEIDNFEEVFNSLTTKICFGISMATEFLISDVWGVLYILFDKYGEDSMKRSLYNQVNSQFSYPMILSSIISTNGWAWRIYIGPLNRFVADVMIYVSNSTIIWSTLCLTEALIIRAMFLIKFKYASSINDNFFSKFIFMFNWSLVLI